MPPSFPPPSSPPTSSTSNTSNILSKSWSQAAAGYNQIFTAKFEPWTNDALTHLEQALHHSSCFLSTNKEIEEDRFNRCNVYIPCCGPGQELLPVANTIEKVLRERRRKKERVDIINVLGLDLSPGMIEIARGRIKQKTAEDEELHRFDKKISVVEGDASLPPPPVSSSSSSSSLYQVIFSCFGLQQIPNPTSVINTWIQSLCIGGIAVILYWPPSVEEEKDGPWSLWSRLVKNKLSEEEGGKRKNNIIVADSEKQSSSTSQNNTPPEKEEKDDWDEQLIQHLQSLSSTITLLYYHFQSHDITWNNFDQFWKSMTHCGPWKSMRLKRGDDFVDGLYDEFEMKLKMDDGGEDNKVVHFPRARLLVFVKTGHVSENEGRC